MNSTNSINNNNNNKSRQSTTISGTISTNGTTTTTTTTTQPTQTIINNLSTTTTTTTAATSNYGGFANCANCGDYGVKAAFYGKSKLYCSVSCQNGIKKSIQQQQQQQQHHSNKRTYDSISTSNIVSLNPDNNINLLQNDKIPSINTLFPPTPTTPNIKIPKLTHINNKILNIDPINQIPLPTPTTPNQFFNSTTSTVTITTAATTTTATTTNTTTTTTSTLTHTAPLVVKSSSLNSSSNSFSWPFYLEYENNNSEAAPVNAFKHVRTVKFFWNRIINGTNGLKVEIPNRDFSANEGEYSYWFATVVKYAGYLAKLRYIGFEDTSTYDFWVHLCDTHIHHVGWAAENDTPLMPPLILADKVEDWKRYLVEKITGCKTLPKNFHRMVSESLKIQFKRGMLVELIDKKKLSRMKVSRIIDNIGGRLRLKYENSEDFDDFWCHQNSELIHPIGWSAYNGHNIDASEEYKKSSLEKLLKNTYDKNECTPDMFKKTRDLPPSKASKQFKISMKLEAIDPLNLSAICVATVAKVLKNNYLMIRIDGCKAEDGSDMFCYHRTSSSIFPAGFCQMNNIPLQAPYDYKGEFNWESYLRETNSEYAPAELFYSDDSFENPFKVGMKLESVDLMEPRMICVATVVAVVDRLIRLNFDGWDSEYDQWVDCESCDIYPVGWCQLVTYQLEPPRKKTDLDNSTNKKNLKKQNVIQRNSNKK